MKLISLLLIIAIMFGACASKKKGEGKDARVIIENYFKARATDPASYQTVNIKFIDTLRRIESLRDRVKNVDKLFRTDSVILEHRIDSIKKTGIDPVRQINYLNIGRSKNKDGILQTDTSYIYLNDTLGVIESFPFTKDFTPL